MHTCDGMSKSAAPAVAKLDQERWWSKIFLTLKDKSQSLYISLQELYEPVFL